MSAPVCVPCRKDMRCVKTGVVVHWGNGHCYAGDRFACTNCPADIVKVSGPPLHMPLEQIPADRLIDCSPQPNPQE